MDALSDLLRVIRLKGGIFLHAEFTTPWCILSAVTPQDCRPFSMAPNTWCPITMWSKAA